MKGRAPDNKTAAGHRSARVLAFAAAETLAPEELRRPSSHEVITRLLYAPTVTPNGLGSLAVRVGAIH